MTPRALRNTLTALLIFCGLLAASAPGQSVTMTVQPDTAFRVFATYRSASGTASSAVNVTVVSRCPAFTIAPVPGTTRGRYVYVLGVQVGACWQVASATVSSRTYFDSLHVAASQQTRFAVAVAPVPPPVPPPAPPPAPPPPPPPPPPPLKAVIVKPPACSGMTCRLDGWTLSTGPAGRRFEWFSICSLCDRTQVNSVDSIWSYTAPNTNTRTRGLRMIAPDGSVSTDSVSFAAPGTVTPPPPLGAVTNLAVAARVVAVVPPDTIETTVTFTPPATAPDSIILLLGRTMQPHGAYRFKMAGTSLVFRQPVGRNPVVSNFWMDPLAQVCSFAAGGVACVQRQAPPFQVVP